MVGTKKKGSRKPYKTQPWGGLFWRRVEVVGSHWVWRGFIQNGTTPKFTLSVKNRKDFPIKSGHSPISKSAAWFAHIYRYGKVPAGPQYRSCDESNCVHPSHMTNCDNGKDAAQRNRVIMKLYAQYLDSLSMRDLTMAGIARQYKLTRARVQQIVNENFEMLSEQQQTAHERRRKRREEY